MKTNAFHSVRRPLSLLACASLLGLASFVNAAAKEPVYENYIDLSAGFALQSGDRAAFQRAFQMRKDGFFGIEDLRYSRELNDTTVMSLRGQAMAGNGDYLLDLAITKEEVGYLKFGYKQIRTYYDGSGGYWPLNGQAFQIYDEDLHIDRGNLWFEAGLTRPNQPSFVLRYDYLTRKGQKDSTVWADSGLLINASNLRSIVPSFWDIDEKRHIIQGTVAQRSDKNEWSLGVRYDKGEYDNARNSLRRPAEAAQRYVTAREGQDFDMTQFRGSYAVDLTEQMKLTTSAARTKYDSTLSGSRIFGNNWDAAPSTTYAGRQQRDEAYYKLPGHDLGHAEMTQTVATIALMYRPLEHLTIVPALRFEKTEWESAVEFIEQNNPSNANVFIIEDVEAESHKEWKTYNYGVEFRYSAVKNIVFNLRADWSKSEGTLEETRIVEPGLPAQRISVDRDSELERSTQKYSFTTSWYPRPGMTIAAQYYYRGRQNDYTAIRDSTPNTITSSDRYPAYISNQDLETNDFNIRLSWRVVPQLRSVTRFDYAKTTIVSQEVGLPMGESMNTTQKIYSQSFTWNPLNRWWAQANLNYVEEQLVTPAVYATGAAANLVTPSNADYLSFGFTTGYALDDQSDILFDYLNYEARDAYVNNAPTSVPYGTMVNTEVISVIYKRQLDRRTALTLRYAYAESKDPAFGGRADYEANIIQAKLQYRF
jgi:hypothetical protein